jgi:hypothetical protein
MGATVVGLEGGAGRWLFVSHFFKGGDHRGAVTTAGIDASNFGFGGGTDDAFECLAEDGDGAVYSGRIVAPS